LVAIFNIFDVFDIHYAATLVPIFEILGRNVYK